MARAKPSTFIKSLTEASLMVSALTDFLEDVADCIRQVAHIAGWIVLLISVVGLLHHQDLSWNHLAAPGAGTLAILQSLIRRKRRRTDKATILISKASEPESSASKSNARDEDEVEALPKSGDESVAISCSNHPVRSGSSTV